MPAPPTKLLAPGIERQLHEYEGLEHLRVSARGDVLTIESGPKTDPVRHARLRRETVSLWTLEMAAHGGRWEPTELRDTSGPLVVALVELARATIKGPAKRHWRHDLGTTPAPFAPRTRDQS